MKWFNQPSFRVVNSLFKGVVNCLVANRSEPFGSEQEWTVFRSAVCFYIIVIRWSSDPRGRPVRRNIGNGYYLLVFSEVLFFRSIYIFAGNLHTLSAFPGQLAFCWLPPLRWKFSVYSPFWAKRKTKEPSLLQACAPQNKALPVDSFVLDNRQFRATSHQGD